jgi:AraC-like DNA-binding protein
MSEWLKEHARKACPFSAVEGLDSYMHRDTRQVMETLAAGTVVTLKRLATGPLDPIEVTFRHRAPASIGEHLRILGPAVRFERAEDTVVYSSATLATPFISADPALLEVFEGDARRRLEALATRGGVSGRVLAFLGARLKGAVPPLSEVASELAMSERSIQRSLSEEQTSYRQLVDDVRKSLAIGHLSRPGTSATDVAFLLGFSDRVRSPAPFGAGPARRRRNSARPAPSVRPTPTRRAATRWARSARPHRSCR